MVNVVVGDVDDDGNVREAAVGEQGEVLVSGPPVFAGYEGDADGTAAALSHGWLHTGDVGFMDDDGFLTLVDRSKDVIMIIWRHQHLSTLAKWRKRS